MAKRRRLTEQTELSPAEIVPFREYDYEETYFVDGRPVLEGPDIPFDETLVGQHEVESFDHLYAPLTRSPVLRRQAGG